MKNDNFVKYINDQMKAGYDRETIRTAIKNQGYDDQTINDSFNALS